MKISGIDVLVNLTRRRTARLGSARALACAISLLACLRTASAASGSPIELVGRIPVPQMSGTWDHLTVDPRTNRLFLSAQDQQTVYVVSLTERRVIHRIVNGFARPQGELYVPKFDRLVVTNGRDGSVNVIDGRTYRTTATTTVSLGADMIAFDPHHDVVFVESGGTDSKRGPGWLAVIDLAHGNLVGKVETDYRAAALVMARNRPRLYAAIPGLNEVVSIDINERRIVGRVPVPGRPASMAVDNVHRRLFVATRTFAGDSRPSTFNVLDADSGHLIATLPSKDATENMYYDSAHRFIYTTSLEGFVQVYRELDADHYRLVATIPTVVHAGTSQFVPYLDELCVAIPPRAGQPAAVWVFRPRP